MTSCLFCKIIEGSIPGEIIYEDDHVVAFMDIGPVSEGHLLLIPKTHRENIYDMTEDEAARLFSVAPRIANALKEEFTPAGLNLLQNNGSAAGQAVYHFHMHFIPRFDQTDGFQFTWDPKVEELPQDRIRQIAEGIRSKLQN